MRITSDFEPDLLELAASAHDEQAVIGSVTDSALHVFPDLPDVLTIRK